MTDSCHSNVSWIWVTSIIRTSGCKSQQIWKGFGRHIRQSSCPRQKKEKKTVVKVTTQKNGGGGEGGRIGLRRSCFEDNERQSMAKRRTKEGKGTVGRARRESGWMRRFKDRFRERSKSRWRKFDLRAIPSMLVGSRVRFNRWAWGSEASVLY